MEPVPQEPLLFALAELKPERNTDPVLDPVPVSEPDLNPYRIQHKRNKKVKKIKEPEPEQIITIPH
jgi:hypothetical protein